MSKMWWKYGGRCLRGMWIPGYTVSVCVEGLLVINKTVTVAIARLDELRNLQNREERLKISISMIVLLKRLPYGRISVIV